MESLHSERNTRKASFCRMWEKRAALWGPCRASASCHTGSASLADSSRCAMTNLAQWRFCVGPREVLRRKVPWPHQHVCGGDRGAVLHDAIHLLSLRPDSWERHRCLLSWNVRLVACRVSNGMKIHVRKSKHIFSTFIVVKLLHTRFYHKHTKKQSIQVTKSTRRPHLHFDDLPAPPLLLPLPGES